MGFPFTINDFFLINFITNTYNNSNCSSFINETIKQLNCKDYLYKNYKNCCNDYLIDKLNVTRKLNICYKNEKKLTYYNYECDYIKNFKWIELIISIGIFSCLCFCCVCCMFKNNKKNKQRDKLISHS